MNKKYRVFISQPMRGLTSDEIISTRIEFWNKNKSIFAEELKCSVKDLLLINTIFEPNRPVIELLGKSVEAMSRANMVVFMKNWEKSRGCVIEHEVVEKYKKEFGDNFIIMYE